MAVVKPFWSRTGNKVPYPGIVQTGNTCVLVSIASAVNWLEQQSCLTESKVLQWFEEANRAEVNFSTVCAAILPKFPSIEAIEYHDQADPRPKIDYLLDRVRSGGVLVCSLEVACPTEESVRRCGRWHMISVFMSGGADLQVWDTNGHAGFLTWDEVRELCTGETLAIPYPPSWVLVSHGQHHCLLVAKR